MIKTALLLASIVVAANAACPFLEANKGDNDNAASMPAAHPPLPATRRLREDRHGPASRASLSRSLDANSNGPPLRPNSERTAAGCFCKSKCGASVDQGLAACDWCYTEGNCGSSAISGYWDYCVYPVQKVFEAQDFTTKTTQLWGDITAPDVVDKSAPAISVPSAVKLVLSESMITAFDNHREAMPAGRSKVIHSQGTHCQFDLKVSSDSKFTGMLAPGTQRGFLRMGSAQTLDGPSLPGPLPIFPGMGIKFLRSGVDSADFVALRATGQGGSWDFFNTSFSNHIAPAQALKNLHKFQQASGCISMVGLSDVCSFDQQGNKSVTPEFPFEILFDPSGVHFPDVKKSNAQFLKELSSIPVGSELFKLYTYASPADKIAKRKSFLGTMSTSSQCHQSIFGDSEFFFRHQRMEEDFALRPGWVRLVNSAGSTQFPSCSASIGPISKWQCAKVPQLTATE